MSGEIEVKIKFPKLNVTAYIFIQFLVTSQISIYDIIFGKDVLQDHRINNRLPKQLRWLERNQDTNLSIVKWELVLQLKIEKSRF